MQGAGEDGEGQKGTGEGRPVDRPGQGKEWDQPLAGRLDSNPWPQPGWPCMGLLGVVSAISLASLGVHKSPYFEFCHNYKTGCIKHRPGSLPIPAPVRTVPPILQ